MVGGLASIYLIGLGIVWLYAWHAISSEPTAHGQSILMPMGCLVGLFWPLVVAYLIIGSPFFAWSLWKTRGER
jgi:hypothetical protein